MAKSKRYPHLGVWLEVDDKNKKVKYRVDPLWLKSNNDENLTLKLDKLKSVATAYRRAGYAVYNLIRRKKKQP